MSEYSSEDWAVYTVERMGILVFSPTLEEMVYFSSFGLMLSAGLLRIFFIMLMNASLFLVSLGLLKDIEFFKDPSHMHWNVFVTLCYTTFMYWFMNAEPFFVFFFLSVKFNWLKCMIFLTSCWIWFASISLRILHQANYCFFFSCWIVF